MFIFPYSRLRLFTLIKIKLLRKPNTTCKQNKNYKKVIVKVTHSV